MVDVPSGRQAGGVLDYRTWWGAMQTSDPQRPLRKLFSALVEHAFCVEIGVCDPRLTDYVVMILCDFIHVDRIHKIRDARGMPLESVAAMLAQLESGEPDVDRTPRRDLHRHIGDYALFWSGLYPEGLRRRTYAPQPDGFLDYVKQGKRAYAAASELSDNHSEPPGWLFGRLSADFETCVHGLGLVRRGWEERDFFGLGDARHLLY